MYVASMISVCSCLHHYITFRNISYWRHNIVLPLVNHSVTSSTFDQRVKLIGSPNVTLPKSFYPISFRTKWFLIAHIFVDSFSNFPFHDVRFGSFNHLASLLYILLPQAPQLNVCPEMHSIRCMHSDVSVTNCFLSFLANFTIISGLNTFFIWPV